MNMWATCDFQQCCILSSVDSHEPVQPPFKLRNSKCCSASNSTFIEYSSNYQRLWSDCAYAQADLRLCWSLIPHCWKSHIAAQLIRFCVITRGVIKGLCCIRTIYSLLIQYPRNCDLISSLPSKKPLPMLDPRCDNVPSLILAVRIMDSSPVWSDNCSIWSKKYLQVRPQMWECSFIDTGCENNGFFSCLIW